jgi:tripartite-type tricarboxylate transporter receptor subunit TctC
MLISRRRFSTCLLGAASATLAAPWVHAQSHTLRILVGFPPGGGTDAIARMLGDKLKDELGSPVIVENKPGAGGQLAAQALKAATPDGHTLFLTHDHTVSILPLVTKNPGFDPAQDFVAVAGFASFVNCFAVSGGTPVKSFADYLKWVQDGGDKAGKGKSAVGVPAPASTPEFLVKLVAERFKLDLVAAPYRGSAPMMADMLGNQIAAGVASIPDFIENHRAGKLHIVGVLGSKRQAALPDVPTFSELGLSGFEDQPYYGLFAPKGTPQTAIDTVGAALNKVLAQKGIHDSLSAMGLTVGYMTQSQLTAREKAYTQVWTRIVKEKGFAQP